MIALTVKVVGKGQDLKVSIEPSASVAELKRKVEEVSEVPLKEQRLIFQGKMLKDDKTLDVYKLADGQTIHMTRSAGQAKASTTTSAAAASPGATPTVHPVDVPLAKILANTPEKQRTALQVNLTPKSLPKYIG
jgi:ubiquilin